VAEEIKRVLVVVNHHVLREALAMRLNQEEDLELIREVSVANPNALALVLSHKLDLAVYHQALGAGAVEVLATSMGIGEVIDAVRRSAVTE
jgi:DNA-binding NarL/FixJ family response regulator